MATRQVTISTETIMWFTMPQVVFAAQSCSYHCPVPPVRGNSGSVNYLREIPEPPAPRELSRRGGVYSFARHKFSWYGEIRKKT